MSKVCRELSERDEFQLGFEHFENGETRYIPATTATVLFDEHQRRYFFAGYDHASWLAHSP